MDIKQFGFYFLLGIVIVLAFKFYFIINDFLPAIASACVLAFIFNPLYVFFNKRIHNRSYAALLVIVIFIVLIFIPLTFMVMTLQNQLQLVLNPKTLTHVNTILQDLENQVLGRLNITVSAQYEKYFSEFITEFIVTAREVITTFGTKMIISITRMILFAFLSIFLMYYLFINQRDVIRTFKNYFPISFKNSEILIGEVANAVKALIFGQFLIAVMQGALTGLGFVIFGVTGYILWGLVAVVLSFLPVFGASIVWFPASIILMAKGDYVNGIGLIIWGLIIVSMSDNIVRPKLTSSLGEIHPVTVLLGVFIGISEWGFVGIVIGPLMITVLFLLIKTFREEYLVESHTDE